ncbi:hypothetical protein MKW98_030414 [Papaver atlanticum]|uniref:Uncharacterized protein n=1 Tax=Papaver atlanticum TaxID=357466 RepID=A0AAD4SU50_9MAGN|nr:hypothetical protein MKW98_030414 [Papaver atlanticum]
MITVFFFDYRNRGTTKDSDGAIDCIRTVLAPCALDAYPEEYEEFKHVLLVLILDKDDQTSPVANEACRQGSRGGALVGGLQDDSLVNISC